MRFPSEPCPGPRDLATSVASPRHARADIMRVGDAQDLDEGRGRGRRHGAATHSHRPIS